MKLPNHSWLIFLVLAAASPSSAAEITGKVRDTGGDMATVAIEGDAMPAVGDSVEIFFKLGDADIRVASGKVAAVEAKVVKVKIENASGTVAQDQFVRIKSEGVAKAPAPSPTATSSTPSPSERDPDDVPNTFKEGQSVIEAQRSPSPRPLATPSPPSLSSPSATPKRFAGRWRVQNENASYILTLRQEGSQVSGSYDLYGGSLKGTVRGNKLVATWQQPGNRRGGSATLNLSADGQTLSGSWAYNPAVYSSGLTGSGTWTFRRQ